MMTTPAIKTVAPKLPSERNNFIEIILLCAIIVLFSWFVLKPKVINLAQKRVELKNIEQQQEMIKTKKVEFESLVTKMQGAKQDFAVLDEALPLQPRGTKLMLLVDSLAKTNGLFVTAVSLDGSESAKYIAAGDKASLNDPYSVARVVNPETVMVSSTGSLEQFMGFLNAVENSTRILDIQNIDISASDDGQLSYKVKIKGYLFSAQ